LPRPFHPPPWASDEGEPALHSPIRLDVSLITEMEMLHAKSLIKFLGWNMLTSIIHVPIDFEKVWMDPMIKPEGIGEFF
jgi:hypothetical protein